MAAVLPADAEVRSGGFVGRRREKAELQAAIRRAAGGVGSFFLVSGEPGIGKSALAWEVAEAAAASGSLVAWGRSQETTAVVPFWPWIQILRSLGRDTNQPEPAPFETSRLAQQASRAPGTLTSATPPALVETEERLELFDDLTDFLRSSCSTRPVVLLLDDLHYADQASLRLLEYVARERISSMLLLGTYRDAQARSEGASVIVTRLAREAHTISLHGLEREDVAAFIENSTGAPVIPDVVSAIHAQTGGNPFYLDQVVRQLSTEGRTGADTSLRNLPEGAREAIRDRLANLSENALTSLTVASIVGSRFESSLVASVRGVAGSVVDDQLEETLAMGLVRRNSRALGAYEFQHDLVREVIETSIAGTERAQLHKRVAEAIEAAPAGDESSLADLARHWFEAIPVAGGNRAVACFRAAGDQAMDRLAWEDAVTCYERALASLSRSDGGDGMRCDLLLALGRAQAAVGDREPSRETHRQAADLARRLRRPRDLARAARGYANGFAWGTFGASDPSSVELLEEALRQNGRTKAPEDLALRSMLLAELVWQLCWAGEMDRCVTLAAEALDAAEASRDPGARAAALVCHHLILQGRGALEGRILVTREIERFARDAGSRSFALLAVLLRAGDLLEAGDVVAADREMASYAIRAETYRQSFFLWALSYWRAMRAIVEGDFRSAFDRVREAHQIGCRVQPENSTQVHAMQSFLLLSLTNRIEPMELSIEELVERYAHNPAWRCGLAQSYAMAGLEADARRELDLLAADDFRRIPRNPARMGSLIVLQRVAIALHDRKRASRLFELLAPYASRNLVVGPGLVCHGPIAYYVGRLALFLGRLGDAERYLRDALDRADRTGMRPWSALSRAALAECLRARAGSSSEADQLTATALAAAQDMGMEPLVGRLSRIEPEAVPEETEPPPPAARPPVPFRQRGKTWEVGSGIFRDSKGLHYIAQLLRCPEIEVHVLDLVGSASAAGVTIRESGTGPVLDRAAKTALRNRLEDLRAELDEAERCNDTDRAARARAEIEWIGGELARAVGLGGRDRDAASSSAQRARVSVRKAIHTAIANVREVDPALGFALDASIRTGFFCVYRPDPGSPIDWQL